MREVSRAHSTVPHDGRRDPKLNVPYGKERIQKKGVRKLNPHYVVGFIDGEGSFAISISKHKTLKRRRDVYPKFEMEVRADDRDILERILLTIGCGRIYDLSYERYGWYPHTKLTISSIEDMKKYLFPFFEKYPLQAKKAESYRVFREVVLMKSRKEHLTDQGFKKIVRMRDEVRRSGKKAKTFGNR